jgi:hypothetical protein
MARYLYGPDEVQWVRGLRRQRPVALRLPIGIPVTNTCTRPAAKHLATSILVGVTFIRKQAERSVISSHRMMAKIK